MKHPEFPANPSAGDVLFSWPAYVLFAPYAGGYAHGDVIALPYVSRRGDVLVNFYKLGSAAGYARQYGEDEQAAVDRAMQHGHKLFWANSMGVSLHNGPHQQVARPAHRLGDVIQFEGAAFRLVAAPNDNVELEAVVEPVAA